MADNEALDDGDLELAEEVLQALSALPALEGPVVPGSLLLSGAYSGFDPETAEAVLMDTDSLAELIGIWDVYQQNTGSEVPIRFEAVVDQERRRGTDRWNWAVAHTTGRCWTDEEFNSALFSMIDQQMVGQDFSERELAVAGSRGTGGAELPALSDDSSDEVWERLFRNDFYQIAVRKHDDGQMLGAAMGVGVTGRFVLVFKWADGHTAQAKVELAQNKWVRFLIPNTSDEMPIQVRVTQPGS